MELTVVSFSDLNMDLWERKDLVKKRFTQMLFCCGTTTKKEQHWRLKLVDRSGIQARETSHGMKGSG